MLRGNAGLAAECGDLVVLNERPGFEVGDGADGPEVDINLGCGGVREQPDSQGRLPVAEIRDGGDAAGNDGDEEREDRDFPASGHQPGY